MYTKDEDTFLCHRGRDYGVIQIFNDDRFIDMATGGEYDYRKTHQFKECRTMVDGDPATISLDTRGNSKDTHIDQTVIDLLAEEFPHLQEKTPRILTLIKL